MVDMFLLTNLKNWLMFRLLLQSDKNVTQYGLYQI